MTAGISPLTRTLLAAMLAGALAACGGGGSAPATPTSPIPPVTPTVPALPATYLLGGTVSGMADGAALTVSNGSDSVAVTANGAFTLPTRLAGGASYNVTSSTPVGHTCSVNDGAGTVGAADVGKIAVKCTAFLLAGKDRLLKDASSIAIDAAGATYVLDYQDAVIWRIDTAGAVSVFAGTRNVRGHQDGARTTATLSPNFLSRMVFDPQGNLIVSDSCNGLIRKITPAGVVSTLAGRFVDYCAVHTLNPPNPSATDVVYPGELAVDGSGNVAVLSGLGRIVYRISAAGDVRIGDYFSGGAALYGAIGPLAFDSAGQLLVGTEINGRPRIVRIVDGAPVLLVDSAALLPPPSPSGVNVTEIRALAAAKNGDLYAALGDTLRRVSSSGAVTHVAGALATNTHVDGTGDAARFYSINSIALNADDSLTVLEGGEYQLRKVSADGVVTTLAVTATGREYADGKAGAARFSSRDALASAADGTVYTIDAYQHVVRKIAADGTVSLLAGIPGKSGADVGPVASATLRTPTAITVDGGGAVFVADYYGLRKITGGVVTLVKASNEFRGVGYLRLLADGGFAVSTGSAPRLFTAGGILKMSISASQFAAVLGVANDGSFSPVINGLEVDAAGNLYIAEASSSVIFRYTPAGVLTVFAGTANVAGNSDGASGSGSLDFRYFGDLTIDGAGNLFLTGAGAIRKISPQGVLSTPSLAWGRPNLLGITSRNGLLYGSIDAGILQTPLP